MCSFTATGVVRAHLCVTSETYFYANFCGARKQVLREPVMMEAFQTPLTCISVDHKYIPHVGSG